MAQESVSTPWETKGTVMRTLVETADAPLELVDGVKALYPDGSWVLALPDPDAPVTQVWAEAATAAEAKSLAKEWAKRVRRVVR